MKAYLASLIFTASLIFMLGIVGCSTTQDHTPTQILGIGMTNLAPVITAVSGALNATPGGQPYGVLLGALSALLAAGGGYLARHHAGQAETKRQQATPPPKETKP